MAVEFGSTIKSVKRHPTTQKPLSANGQSLPFLQESVYHPFFNALFTDQCAKFVVHRPFFAVRRFTVELLAAGTYFWIIKFKAMRTYKNRSRFALGIVLIAIGLVFFAGNFGLIAAPIFDVLTSWPMILVAIGLLNLLKKQYTPAAILFAVAAYFLLPKVVPELTSEQVWRYWPLLLVFVGLVFIFNRRNNNFHFEPEINQNTQDVIDDVALFGGSVSQIESQNFKGGKVTAIFGGSEIHFARAKMSDEGAVIDMAAVFGGVKLVVPRDWNVKVEVTSIFGGFTDKRLYVNDTNPNAKVLRIKGAAVFGGGELANA